MERYAQSRVLIAAHHDESVSWIEDIPPSAAGSNFTAVIYSDTTGGPGYRLVPPGRGKEARSYVMAIIDHYDRLPDAMVFLHGHPYSWHTWAGTGNNVGNTWRMAHEYYVSLSVRTDRRASGREGTCTCRMSSSTGDPQCKRSKLSSHSQAGCRDSCCSVSSLWCLASAWPWGTNPGMRSPKKGTRALGTKHGRSSSGTTLAGSAHCL